MNTSEIILNSTNNLMNKTMEQLKNDFSNLIEANKQY